jgi:NitT/TauT family transport system substrate-binding protein
MLRIKDNAELVVLGRSMRSEKFLICAVLSFLMCFFILSCNNSPSVKPSQRDLSSPTEIRIGISNWTGYLPYHLIDKKSLFKSPPGVTLSVKWYEEYLKGITDLAAGKLDANAQTLIDTVLSIAEGSDQVVVLVLDHSTGNDKIIAKSGINSIKELKGKTISVEKGTVDHYLLLLALKKAGLNKNDVKFMYLDTAKAAEAFAAGKVDATAVFAPFTMTALKKAGSKELTSSKDFPGAISDVLTFRSEFLDNHPDWVQKVVDSWFDALDYIKRDKEAIKIMADRAKISVDEYRKLESGLHLTNHADNLVSFNPNQKGTLFDSANSLKKALAELGLTKNDPDVTGMFDDRFVKAYKSKHQS